MYISIFNHHYRVWRHFPVKFSHLSKEPYTSESVSHVTLHSFDSNHHVATALRSSAHCFLRQHLPYIPVLYHIQLHRIMPKAGSSSSGYVRRKVEPYPHVQSRKESNQRDVRLSTASKRPGAKSVAKVLIQLSDASQRRERTRNFQSRKSPLSIDSSNPYVILLWFLEF